MDGYSDRQGEPYCKACYGKLFGPKGFINGTANFNSYVDPVPQSQSEVPPPPPPRPAPPAPPSLVASDWNAASSAESAPSPQASGRIVNDRNLRAYEAEASQGVFATEGKVSSVRGKFVAAPSNKCAKCAKSVPMPEERRACDLYWHIDCFTCGGLQSDGCKKKLTLDGYTSRGSDPYCRACYNRLFGAKGFVGGSATINTY